MKNSVKDLTRWTKRNKKKNYIKDATRRRTNEMKKMQQEEK